MLLELSQLGGTAWERPRTWSWRTRRSGLRIDGLLQDEFLRGLRTGDFKVARSFKSTDGNHFARIVIQPFADEGDAQRAVSFIRAAMKVNANWHTPHTTDLPDEIRIPNHEPILIEELEGIVRGDERLTRFCVTHASRFTLSTTLSSKKGMASLVDFVSMVQGQVAKILLRSVP